MMFVTHEKKDWNNVIKFDKNDVGFIDWLVVRPTVYTKRNILFRSK